jgi:phage FluMu gp28-like protein
VRASEFTFTAQSVGRVANALHLALRNRLLTLPNDPDLIAELGRVRLTQTSPGAVRLDHDSGEHDDQAVAIAIAVAVLQGTVRGEGRLLVPQGFIRGVGRARGFPKLGPQTRAW